MCLPYICLPYICLPYICLPYIYLPCPYSYKGFHLRRKLLTLLSFFSFFSFFFSGSAASCWPSLSHLPTTTPSWFAAWSFALLFFSLSFPLFFCCFSFFPPFALGAHCPPHTRHVWPCTIVYHPTFFVSLFFQADWPLFEPVQYCILKIDPISPRSILPGETSTLQICA